MPCFIIIKWLPVCLVIVNPHREKPSAAIPNMAGSLTLYSAISKTRAI